MKYSPVIGLEVHVELETRSKMFCGCSAEHFGVEPNIHTCPVCLGLPGALPVPNQEAIKLCLLAGMALNCEIAQESKFDRKHYFYPDLAKGYQISQYDTPFCQNGFLIIKVKDRQRKIAINRVHLEEDTGKLIHCQIDRERYSLIDFNRSGVPLIEVVSEPVIHSSEEAVSYLKKLQLLIRYLGISSCDMEKGSMRCEVNISLREEGKKDLPNYKIEIKNLNSFRFAQKAIEYEILRQKKILSLNKTPIQETRGFNEKKNETFPQRTKETAEDYRYFPEPDIPLIRWTKEEIKEIRASLPELPDKRLKRFIKDYDLSEYDAKILVFKKEWADYLDQIAHVIGSKQKPSLSLKEIARMIVNRKIEIDQHSPQELIDDLIKQKSLTITDKDYLTEVIDKILKENEKVVSDYEKGKREAMKFLIGQAMKETKGRADPLLIQEILMKELRER